MLPHRETVTIREIYAKSVLSVSKVYTYVVNPYVGCQYGCTYCYARYMGRVSGHREPWGSFVDVKVNAKAVLVEEIAKKKRGDVWVSGVCDPYQSLECTYEITRACITVLLENRWPVWVQTKADLVLRDIDVFQSAREYCTVGLSIPTAEDAVRALFEPRAPSIERRLKVLRELRDAGIRTYAMIAPVLPGAERLLPLLKGLVVYVSVDRMNYQYADRIYRNHGLVQYMTDEYFLSVRRTIVEQAERLGITCELCY